LKHLILIGFDVPVNYDDVGLNCGGLGVQKINGIFLVEIMNTFIPI